MVFYKDIRKLPTETRKRVLERLLILRDTLSKEIPERTQRETMLLATWNIRDFDAPEYGKRMEEAIYYLAEIIDHFDLIAIQEVHKDLSGLNRLMNLLGGHWKYIFTDTTKGKQGNDERTAFLYDSRKVTHGGLAGELVLPPIKQLDDTWKPVTQIARTPFICGFRSGWTKFMLATVHIIWGANQANPPERINEIRQVAQFLYERTLDESAWARNLILLGDFNIFSHDNETFKELIKANFFIPEQIQRLPSTSAAKERRYDQIAFRVRKDSLEMTGKAGVFNFYNYVYRDDDESIYESFMPEAYKITKKGTLRTELGRKRYYRRWRTHQMSDHFPMWVELSIDYSDEYLEYLQSSS
jgi:endonuclease/exonuclease/phosphatase family metal-dependent hydrolase